MRKKEIAGLVLLIVGAIGIYLSVQRSTPEYVFLTAKRNITPGETISTTDFVGKKMNLGEAASLYLGGDAKFRARRALRSIKTGEVVPREAVTMDEFMETRRLIGFSVPNSKLPNGLKVGDLFDLYFFTQPQNNGSQSPVELARVYEKLRVFSLQKDSSQLDGKISLNAFIESTDVGEFLTYVERSSITIVKRFDETA